MTAITQAEWWSTNVCRWRKSFSKHNVKGTFTDLSFRVCFLKTLQRFNVQKTHWSTFTLPCHPVQTEWQQAVLGTGSLRAHAKKVCSVLIRQLHQTWGSNIHRAIFPQRFQNIKDKLLKDLSPHCGNLFVSTDKPSLDVLFAFTHIPTSQNTKPTANQCQGSAVSFTEDMLQTYHPKYQDNFCSFWQLRIRKDHHCESIKTLLWTSASM